jgi:hypothetical protein
MLPPRKDGIERKVIGKREREKWAVGMAAGG